MPHPILYSFRRCPYAMRARLGILLAQQTVALREIVLKHKPDAMLEASPKGTVPVLLLESGQVIDESLAIMQWALACNDPHDLQLSQTPRLQQQAMALIAQNDTEFKPWLDKYKYADRHPEHDESYYRAQGEQFIQVLERQLAHSGALTDQTKHLSLINDRHSIADYAIFPFIRQFAHVDLTWWNSAPFPLTQRWLRQHIESPLFIAIMDKYPTWLESGKSHTFGPNIAINECP